MPNKIKKNAGYLCKGNVMTPLNWFASAFEAVLVPTAALQHDNWMGAACFVTAILFAITYVVIYLFIFKKDPNRLQSEEFNLHQQEILIDSGPLSVPNNHLIIQAQANTLEQTKALDIKKD